MRLVPMPLPSSTNALQAQTMPTKSWWLSNGSDGHILTMPSLIHSISLSDFSQQQATSSIVVMTGWRHNHHHIHNTCTRCSTTHTLDVETPTMVCGWKQVVRQQGANTRCALWPQSTPWLSTKDTDCDECWQSGMDDNHTNAL